VQLWLGATAFEARFLSPSQTRTIPISSRFLNYRAVVDKTKPGSPFARRP